jgi:hypothetical protein
MAIPVAGGLPKSNREYLRAVCRIIFNDVEGDLHISLQWYYRRFAYSVSDIAGRLPIASVILQAACL